MKLVLVGHYLDPEREQYWEVNDALFEQAKMTFLKIRKHF